MPTGDLAYTPFNHQHPFAPDLRMQRDTINARDVISSPIRWEGMLVYVLENETTYQLKGGLTNEFWVVFGGTGDISNAVLYTIQSLTPEQQLQARTNIGAAELLDGLISLGAVTATGNDVTIASALARINGVEVGQNDPTVIAVPVPTEGYTRRDLIVIDENALIYLVQGTEVVDGEPALTPNVPADTVVLTEVFSNDAGLQDFYDFAFAHFVRFDINDQGLSPAQRLNARTNIQALSKDTSDSRTGALTQTGLLTVIGDYTQTVSNSTASANAWGFVNTVGGGANFQRRGGLTVVSKGDSATDYFIIRGFDSTETEVFRVRAGGVTKGGDAINNDDFVTLGQVVGLIAAGDTTDMSATDFYTGHQDDLDPDAGVIYSKGPKDIIYEDSGAQFLYPTFMGNLVLANKDIVVNGVGYADIGNEFSITNSTGVIRTLPDNFVGSPAQTAFDFGGVDLDIAPDETVYFKANDSGTAWEVSTVNTVAFSDALNSVNATFSTGPDGLDLITGVYDKNTGEEVTFKETTGTPTPDGVVIVQIGSTYYKNTRKEYHIDQFGVLGAGNDSAILQAALDGVSQTNGRKLIIDGYDVVLTTAVSSTTDHLIIEFRNGAKLSQPTPTTNTTWTDQALRLTLSGNNVRIINLYTDGKFDNNLLDAVPTSPAGFVTFTGNYVLLEGKTIAENSGGYNLLFRGDYNYVEDISVFNNAYSGIRFMPTGDRKSFRIGKFEGINNFGPRGRKTGLTVNGEFYVDLIEIYSYQGINASPFTEATVGDAGPKYYKNFKINSLGNITTQDTQNPDGTPASNYSGKMENCESVIINNFINLISNPGNQGQGMWFNEASNLKIGFLLTNAGMWKVATNTEIDVVHFQYTGNAGISSEGIFNLEINTGRELIINKFISDIPAATPLPYGAIADMGADSILTLNDQVATDTVFMPPVVSVSTIRDQVRLGKRGMPYGGIVQSVKQSISFNNRLTSVRTIDEITRDVITGEWFIFESVSLYIRAIHVTSSGTMSWSGSTFTGTAKFRKILDTQNYTLTAKTNLTALLGSDDRGLTAIVDGILQYWSGSAWVNTSSPDIRYNALTANLDITPSPTTSFMAYSWGSNNFIGSPDDGKYWYIKREVSDIHAAALETAYSRALDEEIWIHEYFSGAWTPWRRIDNSTLSATPSLDFPSIAAGATETLTATVTGAVVGDNVNVTGPTDLYASTCFIQSSWVSSANTVSVRVKNDGGSAVDLASGTYSIKVFPQ